MTKIWEDYFKNVRCMKSEYIDKEKLESLLKYNFYVIDDEVLDNLYIMKLITKEEYQKYLDKYIEQTKERVSYLNKKREDSEDEQFNPLMYYCCCISNNSAIQDTK